jgi:hypothetical protein
MRFISFVSITAITLASSIAQADTADVSVVRSQFTDKVEQSMPVAGSDQLGQATHVTYWVAVRNAKEATTITLVWKLDGHEAGRQSLDVGTSPSWKTWGSHARLGAKSIEVDVLDKSGATIKTDALAL